MTGQHRALLIATDTYSDATFQQLRAPRADADALATVLTDPAIGGYELDALHNPPAHEANLAIEDLFATARLDDLVVLYISGHGIKDDYGQLHLAMTSSRHDRLNATAVNAQFIRDQMDNTRSRRVVVVLDCCFAGAFPPGSTHRTGENPGVLAQLGGRGSAVMTSSSALEYSFETGESADSTLVGTANPSVFTGALIEGLRSGGADRNGDGLIDVDELYDFIYEHVEVAGKPQTPGLDSRFQGRLVVATNPATNDLPHEVAQAMGSSLPSVRLAIVGELSTLLNSDDVGVAKAAHTALAKLTEDDASSVVTAAHEALTRVGTATSPSPTSLPSTATSASITVSASSDVVERNSAPNPPQPVNALRPRIGEAPNAAVPGPSDDHGLPQPWVDAHRPPRRWVKNRQRARRTRLRRGATNTAAIVVALGAAATLLGPPKDSHDGPAQPQQEQKPTESTDVPPGFVLPPRRPTPLPDPVTCHYTPDGEKPFREVTPPPDGEVPAKGIVRATINTNVGAIPAILDRSLAPCTVNNFIHLAEHHFYDNTRCSSGKVPYTNCGPEAPPFGSGSPGYGWIDESFPMPLTARGYLTTHSVYYPQFTLAFEDDQPSLESAALGTISEEGLKILDKYRDGDANEKMNDIIVNGVDIQK